MAFAFVNIAVGSADGSAGTIASAAASHTSGNLLIVFVDNEDSRTVSSIADTALNTYTQRGTNSRGTARQAVWTAFNITGNATNVVTATLSGNATFRRIRVMQYSYANPPALFHDSDNGGGGTPTGLEWSTANSTPTTIANAVIAANWYLSGTPTNVVAGTGFTLRGSATVDSGQEDRIVSATGTYNSSASNDVDLTNWMMLHVIVTESTPAVATAKKQNLSLLGVG